MKAALVSDIHGNFYALKLVVSELKDARVDRVVCLGDVAHGGPWPHEVVSFLRATGWSFVMGNTDQTLLGSGVFDYSSLKVSREDGLKFKEIDDWTMTQLDRGDRSFLSSFKSTVMVGENSMLCFHGSPRSNTERIDSFSTDEELLVKLGGLKALVYAGGHTHLQLLRQFGDSYVINPGSVGAPFYRDTSGELRYPARAEYAIATLSDGRASFDMRRIEYSKDSLAESVKRTGMPNQHWWLSDIF